MEEILLELIGDGSPLIHIILVALIILLLTNVLKTNHHEKKN